MIKRYLLFIGAILFSSICLSQELYKPRSVKEAFANKTRSESGKPGANYWQNNAIYHITLKLTPPTRTIQGTEEITYTNNSPDTLNFLNFKLFVNNHKPGAARLGQAGEDYLTSGTHIDSFSENGEKKEWTDKNDGTNKRIQLTSPLLPHKSIDIAIDWHYDVSKQSGREGAIDSTTFFLAYFYPRVAVYDDYEGWDMMTFTGSQEFYNDFNEYAFEVTVPKDYIVWATGDLLNPREVLQKNYADLLATSMTSNEVIKIANTENLRNHQVTNQEGTNTWKWKASNVSDVAIAVSNHYNWDAGSVVVDTKTNRRASVQAAYDSVSTDFQNMVTYGKHALEWFSNNYPGVPYPYSKSTVVRGFADMEYPMMVNDNSQSDPDFTRFVVEHEIAHTYFPFYMGINETRYGFMDEGWATALEYLISTADLGLEKATENFKYFRVNRWIHNSSVEVDIPIIIPSYILSGPASGNNNYGKAALGYLALKDILGDEGFKTAIQGYMERWHGKHPIPWDFFNSINDVSGKNLNWFWQSWYFSHNYIDLAIENVKSDGKNSIIQLKNVGGMPAPVDIMVTADGKTKTYHQTPGIWKENQDVTEVTLKGVKNISEITLDGGIYMDADNSNNTWRKE